MEWNSGLIGEGGGRLLFGIGATEQEATFTTSIWGSLEDYYGTSDRSG
jgi:hypothetical protein